MNSHLSWKMEWIYVFGCLSSFGHIPSFCQINIGNTTPNETNDSFTGWDWQSECIDNKHFVENMNWSCFRFQFWSIRWFRKRRHRNTTTSMKINRTWAFKKNPVNNNLSCMLHEKCVWLLTKHRERDSGHRETDGLVCHCIAARCQSRQTESTINCLFFAKCALKWDNLRGSDHATRVQWGFRNVVKSVSRLRRDQLSSDQPGHYRVVSKKTRGDTAVTWQKHWIDLAFSFPIMVPYNSTAGSCTATLLLLSLALGA